MKYQIKTATNHEDLARQVNEALAEGWKPNGALAIHAVPMPVQTLQGQQIGITVIFAQSLIDYEDGKNRLDRLPGQWLAGPLPPPKP